MNFLAIIKDTKVYIRQNDKYPKKLPPEDELRFNIPRLPSFTPKWIILSEIPTTVQRCIDGYQTISSYKLKDEFEPTTATPATLDADSFKYIGDDIYLNEDIKGLYDAVYTTIESHWEPQEFTLDIIDQDCEPLISPKYEFATDFPYYIENHDVVRHKYPCHIPSAFVLQYIRVACKENIPPHCTITADYDFHFTVSIRAEVLHEELHTVNVASFNARKPKYVEEPLRSIQIEVINIKTDGNSNCTQIKTLHALNYAELEQKMDAIIQEHIDAMNWKPTVCPHCKGYGWIQK